MSGINVVSVVIPRRQKAVGTCVCHDCGRTFRGHVGITWCPLCRKKEHAYRVEREKHYRALPFYLKTHR